MKLKFTCLGGGKKVVLGIGATWICRCNREWTNNQGLRIKSMWGYLIPIEGIDFKYTKEKGHD